MRNLGTASFIRFVPDLVQRVKEGRWQVRRTRHILQEQLCYRLCEDGQQGLHPEIGYAADCSVLL